tara:strand:+ start:42 stop:566 length:525 start_codon:yes stop_codon:yes gene_type:complete
MKKKYQDKIDEIIRVNHAGEYGAQRIYSGQIRFCKKEKLREKLEKIIEEEFEHFEYFNKTMVKKRTRPTVLSPIWHHGGYALGAFTSILGEKYVHACTEAVEEVIVEHYNEQIKYLETEGVEKGMLKKIKKFCADEDNHRSFAEESNLNNRDVNIFKSLTKGLTRLAIRVSKKI